MTLRVIVDTNALISDLLGIKNSPSAQILKAIRNQKIILVTSPVILEEVADVINRERIIRLTKMNVEERKRFIEELIERSDVTKGAQLLKTIGRDVKDDKLLTCAFEAKANYVITGDHDLLVLKEYKGTKIITPRKFLSMLAKL